MKDLFPDKATFHLMGNLTDLYKYNEWKNDMMKYYTDIYEIKSGFSDFWKNGDYYEKYQLYHDTIEYLLINDNKYKIGDWIYREDLYETRQYYGIGRVSFNLKKNKKTVFYYEEDGPFTNNGNVDNKYFPKAIQNLINQKKDFDKEAYEKYLEYFTEPIE
jgi:hypothetical protein